MRDFTEGNSFKHIVAFAMPMLIGAILQQVYSMVDAVIVGRYVGGLALAAVGISINLLGFLLSVLIGLTTGASVVISQLYGAKQHDQMSRAVSTSIIFLGVLSVLISVLGVAGAPLFLRMLGAPADVFDDALIYLRWLMGGMMFPIFFNMYTAYLRALGDSNTPLYILVFSTVLNTGLDLYFVAVLGMGVAGAAIATIIAQTLAAVICYWYVHKKVPLLRIGASGDAAPDDIATVKKARLPRVRGLVFDLPLFFDILRYSIPAALQLSLTSLASLTITRLINSFGAVAVAGYTAALKIDQLAIMPQSNISMAISTFVAQNMGAGREDRAKKGLASGMALMMGAGIFITVIAFFFSTEMISMFVGSADPNAVEIVGVGAQYLEIIVIFYILFGVFFAFNGFFRGVGDATIVMVLCVVSLGLRAVAAHFLVAFAGMGPEAVAWSIPIGWSLCTIAAYVYYKKRLWAGKTVVKSVPESVS
jgi:putative MATE family efflux protein